jgi:hypothetical protein
VNNQLVCTQTPCVADIERQKGPMTIIAKADGYEDAILQNKTKLNPLLWLNILGLGYGLFSSTTDFATDSMWKYSQNGIFINMEKTDMDFSEKAQFKKDSEIRQYALYSYADLKMGRPEYMEALSGLTGKNKTQLRDIIDSSSTEAELAINLTAQ